MIRKRVVTSALVVLGIVFGALMAEGLIRVAQHPLKLFPDRIYQPDKFVGWVHIPDKSGIHFNNGEFEVKVKINSKGLRDYEYSYQKPPGVFRILLLGDSFTEAIQVPLEDSWPKVLEQLLNNGESTPKIQVINAGVGSYGTDNALLLYEHEVNKYEPDLVILTFHLTDPVDNDHQTGLIDSNPKPYFVLDNGTLVLRNYPVNTSGLNRVAGFMKERSYMAFFFGKVLTGRGGQLVSFLTAQGLLPKAEKPTLSYYSSYLQDYPPELERAWKITGSLLTELKGQVEKRGARLVVIFAPDSEQIEEEVWQEVIDKHSRPGEGEWNQTKPNVVLDGLLNKADIPLLQLLPGFRQRYKDNGKPLHYRRDSHWNLEGNRLAAQLIYDYVLTNKLVPVKGGLN